jgi:mRNA interferase HicA
VLHLTTACKRPPIAYAPASLRLSAAPEAQRSVAEIQRLLTVYTYPCTVKPMKRRDLERALRQLGWYFLRHGGKHDVWNDGKREEAIPRHTEIHDKLAQAILRRVKGSAYIYAIARTCL